MSHSTDATVKVHPIQDYSSLLALKPTWDLVWSGSRQRWPSTTWAWIASWWQNLRDDRNLVVLEASRQGRPIGIAPFSWGPSGLGCSRQADIAGSALVDFGDFACVAEEEEAATAAIARHFLQWEEWETLSLDRLMWTSERIEAWVAPFVQAHHTVNVLSSAPTWQASVSGSWEDFTTRLGTRWREHLRRKQRRLEERGAIFSEAQSAQEACRLLHRLYHLRAQTDDKEALPGQVERHFRFHSAVLDDLMKHGLARMFSLTVEGEVIAVDYGFHFGNSYLYYLPGYSRAWKEYSPGNVLLAHCIQAAIRTGLSVLDLGIGDEEYKTHWLAKPVATQKIVVQSRRAAARIRRGVARCVRAGNRAFRALKNLN